jgi:hypothetical protein
LDVQLDVGGWVDGRGGGITDGVGEGCLFGRFELLTVSAASRALEPIKREIYGSAQKRED